MVGRAIPRATLRLASLIGWANKRRVTWFRVPFPPGSSNRDLLLHFPRLTAVEEFLQAARAEALDGLLNLILHQIFIGGLGE